ncbi:tandem-95 repeat protein, partial [Magnetococcales bacterium HHB-1]
VFQEKAYHTVTEDNATGQVIAEERGYQSGHYFVDKIVLVQENQENPLYSLYSYTPERTGIGFGAAQFDYRITDGNKDNPRWSEEATLYFEIYTASDQAPPVLMVGDAVGYEDSQIRIPITVYQNANPNEETISVTIKQSGSAQDLGVTFSSGTFHDDGFFGKWTFTLEEVQAPVYLTPAKDFYGNLEFHVSVTRTNNTTLVSTTTGSFIDVTVENVQDNPIAVDDHYTMMEDTVFTSSSNGVLLNDSDVDGDMLSIHSMDTLSFAGGRIKRSGSGGFIYTPPVGFFGEDYFEYVLSDKALNQDVGTVYISVSSVDDAFVLGNDYYTLSEDTVHNIDSYKLLSNDSDASTYNLSVDHVDVESAVGGTVQMGGDGWIRFTPDPHFYGEASYDYIVSDKYGDQETSTVYLTVTAKNDAPIALDNSYTMTPGGSFTGNLKAFEWDKGNSGVTYSVASDTSEATLSIESNGFFTYTADPNNPFIGIDQFRFTATDSDNASSEGIIRVITEALETPL